MNQCSMQLNQRHFQSLDVVGLSPVRFGAAVGGAREQHLSQPVYCVAYAVFTPLYGGRALLRSCDAALHTVINCDAYAEIRMDTQSQAHLVQIQGKIKKQLLKCMQRVNPLIVSH